MPDSTPYSSEIKAEGMSNNERALVNRGNDPYSNDIKAEAIALVYETNNFHEAEREMARRYPDRHPNNRLIIRWFKQLDPERWAAMGTEREEAFKSGIMEMAEKATGRLYDALDTIKDAQVPIPSGIGIDKGIELLKLQKGGGQLNVQFNLVTSE
jgi:hypothetical protein